MGILLLVGFLMITIKPFLHDQIFFDKFVVPNAFAQKLTSQFFNTCICQNKFGENS
jgi:hypothetical protein